eukprot:1845074-Pyramimonas_sp.AAC.1
MLFTAKSRKPVAPTVKEATKAVTGASSSSGSDLTGTPLWEAIIQSVLHHSTINGRKEQIVCNFRNGRIPCPNFFNACEEHQTAVIRGLRAGSETPPQAETILGPQQVVDCELMLVPRKREHFIQEFHVVEQFYDADG